MRIILTVNAAWNIWNFRQSLVAALLADGHHVTILAPEDESVARLEEMGCAFVRLPMDAKGLNPLEALHLVRTFRTRFKELAPDAVLSFTIKNNICGALAAKSLGISFVPNVTGLGTAFLSGGILQGIAKWLYRRAFARLPFIFFQNEDDRDLFIDQRLVRASQARLLPGSGIDLERFAPARYPYETSPRFLMISRLLRDKGVVEYVEAARIVKRTHPGARFLILGAAAAENRTAIGEGQIAAWQDDGLIEHLVACEDVRPLITDAHCVVLPSYREGAPRTLIEAAAMARPLIATDVPGCRSVVEHGRTGFLCEVRNAESLAKACLGFLDCSTKERVAMGRAGRAKMEQQFDHRIVIAAYRSALAAVPLD